MHPFIEPCELIEFLVQRRFLPSLNQLQGMTPFCLGCHHILFFRLDLLSLLIQNIIRWGTLTFCLRGIKGAVRSGMHCFEAALGSLCIE